MKIPVWAVLCDNKALRFGFYDFITFEDIWVVEVFNNFNLVLKHLDVSWLEEFKIDNLDCIKCFIVTHFFANINFAAISRP